MIATLLAVWARYRTGIAELAGASSIVAGAAGAPRPAAWIVAGALALLKAFEWDLRAGDG